MLDANHLDNKVNNNEKQTSIISHKRTKLLYDIARGLNARLMGDAGLCKRVEGTTRQIHY